MSSIPPHESDAGPHDGTARGPGSSSPSGELLRRLADARPRGTRYRIENEIARGGMGAILRVRDEEIGRDLAMKVALGSADSRAPAQLTETEGRDLGRFLEEAQITGQLDHPGVVPVHELGIDEQGRLYFTMKLVKGRELRETFELVRERREGWNRTRALVVIQKVCEAVAYAHSKGVIHRDIKPANVMVGEFGEVYVMDWGLARAIGRKDNHDLRLRADLADAASIRTERRREKEESSDSPLLTMDGDVVGTPCYMAPEQAQGRIAELGPRSDVYSVGALLYELLTGEMPYVERGAKISNRTVLAMVLHGPPKRILEIDRKVPEELVAICEKAMRRDARERYPDTLAMGEDLRAFLENRVVAAHASGAVAELRKWVSRNKPLAAVSAAALLLALVGLGAVLWVESRRRADAEEKNVALAAAREVAESNEARAKENAALAGRKAEDVLRLSAIQDLQDLVVEADELWPAEPANIEAYERWLARARLLADGLDGHRARLAEIRARSTSSEPADDGASASGAARGFDGTWMTDVANLALRTEGDRVVGVYMPSGQASVLEGRLEGSRLEFTFSEPGGEGRGWFELAEDGESFTGQRKVARSANWVSWSGQRRARTRSHVENADFEGGVGRDDLPAGWDDRGVRPRTGGSAGSSVRVDAEVRHGGLASARLEAPVDADELLKTHLSQEISAEPFRGKRLRMTAWVKTAAETRNAGLWARIDTEDGMLALDNMALRFLRGANDWRECTVVHDVPEAATRISFGALLLGGGTTWVDDFAFDVVGPEVAVTTSSRVRPGELAERDHYLSTRRTWFFASTEDRWWHNQLERFVHDLEAFVDPKDGLVSGSSPEHGLGIEPRLAFAREVEETTTSGAEARAAWDEAIRSIRDPKQCPAYRGLAIRPQLGLVPIGRDRHSGLWEFAHLLSGDPAKRMKQDGLLRMRMASGLVFVLIPGGEFTLGAQSGDAARANHDLAAQANEGPPHTVVLAPFFLSKHEMTQRQWQRISGENPSNFEAGTALGREYHSMLHPVEQVSWIDCALVLERMSLVLPTEAQWEYAARAGTTTPWWTGADVTALRDAANLPDASVARAGIAWQEGATLAGFDDGYVAHAPVDAFRANPFGLHNVHGNVWEWCRDWFAGYDVALRPGDGERLVTSGELRERVVRGGAFNYGAERARSSNRVGYSPTLRVNSIGVRPARAIAP